MPFERSHNKSDVMRESLVSEELDFDIVRRGGFKRIRLWSRRGQDDEDEELVACIDIEGDVKVLEADRPV
ncbi:MAG: hypothetical protein ACLPY5_05995 [Candidatus Bathyarchaeia archaeon]